MVKKLHWYPFKWNEYSTKTLHLSQGEHGAYILLMRYTYTREAPVPDKQRYSIAKAVVEQERSNVDNVLAEFFRKEGDNWVNDTCFEIISKQHGLHQKKVTAGKLGGIAKSSNAKANGKHPPTNKNQSQKDISNDISPLEAQMYFTQVWEAYPGRGKMGAKGAAYKGEKQPAFKKFHILLKAEKDHDKFTKELITGAYLYTDFLDRSGYSSKHLTTWLNGQCWKDDYSSTDGPGPRGGGLQSNAQALAEGVRRTMRDDGSEGGDLGGGGV